MQMEFDDKESMDELRKLEQDKVELEKKTAEYTNSFAEEIVITQPPVNVWGGEVVVKKETAKEKGMNIIKRLKTVLGWN